jgi:hypothetical protein
MENIRWNRQLCDAYIEACITNPPLYLFRGHNISPPRARASAGTCPAPWTPSVSIPDGQDATSNGGTLQPIRQWRSLATI